MKKCIHCLGEIGPFNDDHVFPNAWYPENTPNDVRKLTAPSCMKCNNILSKVKERLLRVFSFGFSPNEIGHKGIFVRMKRSISESAGKNKKDKKVRGETKRKFFRNFFPAKAFPKYSIVNPKGNTIESDSLGIIFSVDDLNTFLKKVAKGIIFNFGRENFVPPIFIFSFFHFQCQLFIFNVHLWVFKTFSIQESNLALDFHSFIGRIQSFHQIQLSRFKFGKS